MARLSNNILELRKRREECLSSALIKIEDIFDFTKIYNMQENKDVMRFVLQDLKSKVKTQSASDGSGACRYIDTKVCHKTFAQDITDLCADVYNNVISKEVKDFKKDIKTYIDFAEDCDKKMYEKSVNDIVYLYSISKEKDMDKDLYQIYTDLLSCLNYNIKIIKEMELG